MPCSKRKAASANPSEILRPGQGEPRAPCDGAPRRRLSPARFARGVRGRRATGWMAESRADLRCPSPGRGPKACPRTAATSSGAPPRRSAAGLLRSSGKAPARTRAVSAAGRPMRGRAARAADAMGHPANPRSPDALPSAPTCPSVRFSDACAHARDRRRPGPGAADPALWLVLVNPGVEVPTGPVFKALARVENAPMPDAGLVRCRGLLSWLAGDAERSRTGGASLVPGRRATPCRACGTGGCRLARMSGSGATCFGLFTDEAVAATGPRLQGRMARTGGSRPPRPDARGARAAIRSGATT
jgi:hypothetical protein